MAFAGQPTCGATRRDGGECMQPAGPNGRCRLHGGKSTGPRNPFVKHGLYRKHLSADEQELYDHLVDDGSFDDLTREVAMMRVMINRCVLATGSAEDWRVPLQALPGYVDKLLRLIERMRPQAQRVVMTDDMDLALTEMLNEEAAARAIPRDQQLEPSDPE
jgi:hypothetical protein